MEKDNWITLKLTMPGSDRAFGSITIDVTAISKIDGSGDRPRVHFHGGSCIVSEYDKRLQAQIHRALADRLELHAAYDEQSGEPGL